jgi:hypothetical protein
MSVQLTTRPEPKTSQEDGYDISRDMKITIEITNPTLKTALQYWAEKDGYESVEHWCLSCIQSWLATEDERFN